MTSAVVPPLFQGVAKDSAGYKLLAAMGWREGEGLGANKQGIKEHVKVKKKHDAMGVGAAENAHSLRDWTTGMVSFDRILANLKEVTASRPAVDDGSSSSDEDERPAKASPSKPKVKSDKKNKNKRKRQQSSSPPSSSSDSDAASTSSGSSSSSDDEDDEGKTTGSVKRVKLASHVGRYSKRERAKFVKNYSASDLDAILGGPAKQAAAEEEVEEANAGADPLGFMPALNLVEVRAAAREDDSSSSDEEEGGEGKPETEVKAAAASAPAAASGEGKKQRKAKAEAAAPPPAEEWEPGKKPWWAGMFVRAGRMGSIKQELKGGHSGKPKINVSGFREQDQENLYEQVQHGAAHGRQGLGRSDMPKKVAGARWCGTKTKISDGNDDEEEEEEEGHEQGSGSGSGSDSEPEDDKIVIVRSKKEQQEDQQQQGPGQAAGTAGCGGAGADDGKVSKRSKRKEQQREAGADGGSKKAQGAPESAGKGKGTKEGKKDKGKGKEGKDKKRKREEAAEDGKEQAAGGSGEDGASGKQPKWRKVVKQLLADAPERRIKLNKLWKQLEKQHGLGGDKGAGVLEQLRGSSKFKVCDKFVTLAA